MSKKNQRKLEMLCSKKAKNAEGKEVARALNVQRVPRVPLMTRFGYNEEVHYELVLLAPLQRSYTRGDKRLKMCQVGHF